MGKAVNISKRHVFIALGILALLFVSFTVPVIIQKQHNSVVSEKSAFDEVQNPVQGGQSNTFVRSNTPSDNYMNVNNDTLIVDVLGNESFDNTNEVLIRGTITANVIAAISAITVPSGITDGTRVTAASGTTWIPMRSAAGETGTVGVGGVSVLSGTPGTTPINWTITLGGRMSGGTAATDGTSITAASVLPRASDTATQPAVTDSMGFIDSGTFYRDIFEEMEEEENSISNIINVVQRIVQMKPFTIGKYEVTQKEYREVMGKNPSYFIGDNLPVESVSWYEAIEYCNALSRREGLPVAYKITGTRDNIVVTWDRNSLGYRLPTEAEWEYSCRAGTRTLFNTGDFIDRNQANFFNNTTVEVGSYPPNEWGLHDMHGNVAEWCWDLYNDTAMGNNDSSLDDRRVIRGGSWINYDIRLRSASRDYYFPSYRSVNIGFRVARNVPNTSSFFR